MKKSIMKDIDIDMKQILLIKKRLEEAGMTITGQSNGLIEAVEIKDHPWFVGVQFHPEFTSHLETPNPIILEFVKQANANK